MLSYLVSFIMFLLGMWTQNQIMKRSHIREKAKKLDEEVMKNLKFWSNEVKKRIDDANYISVNAGDIQAKLKFYENEYVDLLINSGIFKVKDKQIALTYQEDKILKKHAKIIIENLEKYHSEVSSLNEIINNLKISTLPLEFEIKIRNLIGEEPDIERKSENLNDFLFILYVISISGSKNSYQSGRVFIIELIKKRYRDLQIIAKSDSKNMNTFTIIEKKLINILSCLKALNDEIDYLHDDWQNKLII